MTWRRNADVCQSWRFEKAHHLVEGINSRMDGLQAAILSAKLPHILKWTEARIEKAAMYKKYLADVSEIKLPAVRPDTVHSWHLFVIRTTHRDALMSFLKEQNIETAIHYPTALPNLPAYAYLGKLPQISLLPQHCRTRYFPCHYTRN